METNRQKLEADLKGLAAGTLPPVFLVYGDELLSKQAFETLLPVLVPPENQSLNYEARDGALATASDIIEALDTYPMFPSPKAVAWLNTLVLAGKKETRDFLEKARKAFDSGDAKKARKWVLDFLSVNELSFEDADRSDPLALIARAGSDESGDWLKELLASLMEEGAAVPEYRDESDVLAEALAAGFPPDNRLILVAPAVDKKKRLFKFIKEKGLVVDCTVPAGTHMAARKGREEVVRNTARETARSFGKSIDPGAVAAIVDRVGEDLRAVAMAVEKLVPFVGDRDRISAPDVVQAIIRTRQDPIYLFTEAVFSRNTDQALSLLSGLLEENVAPLALVGSLVNQVRRFLAAQAFLQGPAGGSFQPGMPFKAFETQMKPLLTEHDNRLRETLASWVEALTEAPEGKKGKKPKKSLTETDLALAPKGRSLYPVYLALKRVSRLSEGWLANALLTLYETDKRLKSTGQDPRRVMEILVLKLAS